eukprot:gene2792-5637_t
MRTVTNVELVDVQRRRIPSKHYVYVIEVTWSDGSVMTIYRRYSQFFEMHVTLLEKFPVESGTDPGGAPRILPFLPGKKLFGRSHTHKVAQSRARTLAEYLKALIKMPEKIMTSMCVLDFFDANAADIKPISEQEREKQPTSLIKRIIPSSSETPKPKDIDVGDVMALEQYRAVASYTKQAKNELTFQAGDVFDVVEKTDNGWWFVNKGAESQGWVPATFLEPTEDPEHEEQHSEPVPNQDEKYISVHAYTTENDDEVGFGKGAVVRVLQKKLDGWWKISYQNKTGWAPGSYLERLEVQEYQPSGLLEKDDSNDSNATTAVLRRPRTNSKAPPPRRESILHPDTIHGQKGPFAIQKSDLPAKPAWVKSTESKQSKSSQPNRPPKPNSDSNNQQNVKPKIDTKPTVKPIVPPSRPEALTKQAVPDKPEKPTNSSTPRTRATTQNPPTRPQRPSVSTQKQIPQQQPAVNELSQLLAKRMTMANGVTVPPKCKEPQKEQQPLRPPQPVAADKPTIVKRPRVPSKSTASGSTIKGLSSFSESSSSQSQDANEYVVLEPYTADEDPAISISKGEQVQLLEKSDTGWWYIKKNDGQEGWAPAELLEKANQGPIKPPRPAKPSAPHPPNQIVTVLDQTDGWWFCKVDSKEGWYVFTALGVSMNSYLTSTWKIPLP